MKTILIVDDDISVNDMLNTALRREGYRVLRCFSGTEALMLLEKEKPDLILLDLMLPGMNGEDVIKNIHDIPVIVLSAKIDLDSRVNMLLDGASDYILKPFELRELLARIKVQLRKNDLTIKSCCITCGDIKLDAISHRAYVCGNEIRLTKTEFVILEILMLNHDNVVTKSYILDSISSETFDCMESSLKVHISNIRKKLRVYSDKEYIEAVWGIGFKLNT